MCRSPISLPTSLVMLTYGLDKERDITMCQNMSLRSSVVAHLPSNRDITSTIPITSCASTFSISLPPHHTVSPRSQTRGSLFTSTSTHTSSECLQLPAPSHGILKSLRACAGQAMLDGKISVQHWDHSGIFLPFNALGIWALIIEADTAKNAWRDALTWLDQQHCNGTIPTQYIPRVMKLLGTLPWKDHIKGLSSWLSITDMATFLSQDWLSDAHIDSMLSAAMHLRRDTLSHMVPRTELFCPTLSLTYSHLHSWRHPLSHLTM
jgi:hypothetical protein